MASVQELRVETGKIFVCTGIRITPIIKRRSLNEISLLFVSLIRAVSAMGRKFSFKGQVISQSYRIILTPGS